MKTESLAENRTVVHDVYIHINESVTTAREGEAALFRHPLRRAIGMAKFDLKRSPRPVSRRSSGMGLGNR